MTTMLGRRRVPGCCPGAREGRPGPDCSGGEPLGTRLAKRLEAREVAAEIAGHLSREVPDPFADASDCVHGCSGSPSCTGERCTFSCHPR